MSMKSSDSPRRLYTRRGIVHVCLEGKYFGPNGDTAISLDQPVVVTKVASDGGRARVEVTQKRPGRSTLKETWRTVSL